MQSHSFGDWLKRKRNALDLTQAELANQVGCSAAAIRKIEAEERRPSAQIVGRLAEIFEIPKDQEPAFLRFARGDVKSAPPETKEDFPWQASAAPIHSNFPATVTSLIGRQKEIADIQDYLSRDDIRLVTLMGPPGIGKTRLSIESARALLPNFPNGVFFVALAPLNDPALIPQTVAQSLGYVGTRNISTTDQIKEGIGQKQILLVLDNCEHLIEEVAALASFLLSACSRLKILATSRESARIPGEWLYPVPAFELPKENASVDLTTASNFPALTLFAERARAVRPDFILSDENVKTVSTICAYLDGLPLGIELIAARIRLMSPEVLLARLDSQFILSADGMRARSTRQKTLNNAIGWSYNLLSDDEKRLFAYLSVFSGGFTLDMAEAVFSSSFKEKSVSNLISLLLDKSLLQLVQNRILLVEARYTMLVTIQEYARERLREMGEEVEIRNLHLTYFLNLAEKAGEELRSPHQLEWLYRLGVMRDDLRAALEWAIETQQTTLALRFVRKLDWFWFIRSDHNEGRQWLERVLKMPDTPMHHEAHAEALYDLAHHIWLQIGYKEAHPYAEQALSIARLHNDKHNTARALSILGLVLADKKNFTEAQSALEESRALYQEVGDEWGSAHALTCLGHVWEVKGSLGTAYSLREQALELFRKLGDKYFESATLSFLGIVQVMQGNVEDGVLALQKSLTIAQQLDSKYEIAMILWNFARVSQAKANHPHTVHLYIAAKKAYDSIGAWTKEDELKFEEYLTLCRATLSEAAFTEAVERGRVMTMEQAIEYALELSTS